MNRAKPLDDYRIGILGKGGSGKSTLAVLLARALTRRGYGVCVLDADSTNVGLHRALGINSPVAPLLDHFGGMVFSGGAVTCPVDDPTLLPGAHLTPDRLPPAYYARSPEGILLLTAGKMGEQGPGAGCDGPVAKIARDIRVTGFGEHPIMVVDFKAGFEDAARGTITSLDLVLVTVDATQAALKMAVDLQAMVRELQAGAPPATQHLAFPELAALARQLYREARIKRVYVVLNKVAGAETEQYMRRQLAAKGIEPLGILRPNSAIAGAWLRGEPLVEDAAGTVGDWIAKALEADQRVRPPVMA